MGSMGKRRGRRTRSDSGGRRRNVEEGFPTFRHNQWTFEGEIERLGHLARSISRVRRSSSSRRQPLAGVTHAIVTFLVLVVAATVLISVVRAF